MCVWGGRIRVRATPAPLCRVVFPLSLPFVMLRGGRGLPCGKQQSAGPGPAEVLAQAVGQELPHDLGRVRHQAGQIYEEKRLRFDRQIVMLLSSLRAPRLIGIHGQIYGEHACRQGRPSAAQVRAQRPAPPGPRRPGPDFTCDHAGGCAKCSVESASMLNVAIACRPTHPRRRAAVRRSSLLRDPVSLPFG